MLTKLLSSALVAAFGILFTAFVIQAVQIEIGKFRPYAHDLRSGTVTLLDTRRVLNRNIYYDGAGPDAWFSIGLREPCKSMSPSASMNAVSASPKERDDLTKNPKIPDERGSCAIVRKYTGQSIILTLPDGLTWEDVGYLSLYCYKYQHNFGYIRIPTNLSSLDKYVINAKPGQVNFCK